MRGTNTSLDAGRLEVQIGGVWGTVCAENFGESEAIVACRQLGKKGGIPHGQSRYGAGPAGRPVLVAFPYPGPCNGYEDSLTECQWESPRFECFVGEAGLECTA